MVRPSLERLFRKPSNRHPARCERSFSPCVEGLEERVVLNNGGPGSPGSSVAVLTSPFAVPELPAAITVGRTQSSYTTDGVQGGELRLTYTVYNETADELRGVLLTTTLQDGVAFKSASAPPDPWSGADAASPGAPGLRARTMAAGFRSFTPQYHSRGGRSFQIRSRSSPDPRGRIGCSSPAGAGAGR